MAIAFDATSNQNSSASDSTTKTWNHTCAAGAVLIVFSAVNNGKTTTGVTYNGVALTAVNNQSQNNENLSCWILLNPASGTNTVEVTFSASNWNQEATRSLSYTGASAQDATAKNASATDTVTQTITTVANNAMVIGGASQITGGTGFNWTNLTARAASVGLDVADDLKASAGGLSVTAQNVTNSNVTLVLVSLSPAATYTLTSAQGAYILTGFDLGVFKGQTISLAQGAFSLTGQAISFILALLWNNVGKNSNSLSNLSKNTSSWSNSSKSASTMTNQTKH